MARSLIIEGLKDAVRDASIRQMTHGEFVERAKARTIRIDVDTSAALSLFKSLDLLPARDHLNLFIIFTIAVVSIIAGLAMLYFAAWYVILGFLLFGLGMIFFGRFEAGVAVLTAALRDPRVYIVAMQREIFHITHSRKKVR